VSRKPVNPTRKRRSRAEVSRLVEEYLRSGLSLKAFCQQHDLDRSTLAQRLQQRQNPTAQEAPTSGWVRIGLARNFDAATLRQLLRLLESR